MVRKRKEVRNLLQKRKMERIIIQKESDQILEPNVDEGICQDIMQLDDTSVNQYKLNKSGFRGFFRNHRDNKWNDLTFSSGKTAKYSIPTSVIKKDEEAVHSILAKIKQEKQH